MMEKSPFEKEQIVQKIVLDAVRKSQKGMSITELQKVTNISRKTLEKHLQLLTFMNEIHMNQYGPTRVYYPNRKLANFKSSKADIFGKSYFFDMLENQNGKFLLIQEKRTVGGEWQTKGSIIIPEKGVKEFLKRLNEFAN